MKLERPPLGSSGSSDLEGAPASDPSRGEAGDASAPFSARVTQWQRRHGRRGLPWQSGRDPYRVWLSEVMLQQTQVSTVLAYYARFLERFPNVRALAAASLDDVLAQWSGLGYYSRARNLHRCAERVVAEHAGRFPQDAHTLSTLPGIGRSTAAAIAAFCFGQRAAIFDGNVKRVLARALAYAEDLAVARHERELWQRACELLPTNAQDMPAYTQGLMDLGATLCTPRRPNCPACPLETVCRARREGRPEAYPVKTRKNKRSRRESWCLWLQSPGAVWLQQRPASGVWSGLWSFPLYESEAALAAAASALGVGTEAQPTLRHALTHFDWTLHPHRAQCANRREVQAVLGAGRWVELDALHALGLPAPLTRWLESAPRAAPPTRFGASGSGLSGPA